MLACLWVAGKCGHSRLCFAASTTVMLSCTGRAVSVLVGNRRPERFFCKSSVFKSCITCSQRRRYLLVGHICLVQFGRLVACYIGGNPALRRS